MEAPVSIIQVLEPIPGMVSEAQICIRGRRTGPILSHSAGGLGTLHTSFVISKPIREDRQESWGRASRTRPSRRRNFLKRRATVRVVLGDWSLTCWVDFEGHGTSSKHSRLTGVFLHNHGIGF
ncbi:hypothetical protein Prudu_022099 [Prunus dulcis]|uniref:Uncharacterized protein n=1 Tax=Prunus dulcis TaxID=3755 RepID=A0A4Y1RZY8_PRUDU|nr:hypothetical protein Prudu_022099 [Prunus dulcis]